MTTTEIEGFDEWYRDIAASTRWDRFTQEWLHLPPDVQSTGCLTGAGLVEVRDRLRLAPGGTLVELGCGRGGYGMALVRDDDVRLVGVDLSEVALAEARRAAARMHLEGRVEFRAADLTSTGLPSAVADAVLCVDAFQFARPPQEAAREAARLLRPGGRAVVTSWEPVERGDERLPDRFRQLDVAGDLARSGLVDVAVEHRDDWSVAENLLWTAALALDAAGDRAMISRQEEARRVLSLAAAFRRILVTATAPG